MSESDNTKITATSHFSDKGQMSIYQLPGAVPYGETALPLLAPDVAFADQARSDKSMMQEANMNRGESESFIATRGLIGQWNTAEIMLRAWVDPIKWKGSDQFRSHLGIPLVAEQFYSIHSVVNQTLFGGYRIFKIDATSGTPIGCAEAQEALLNAELKTCGFMGVSAKTNSVKLLLMGFSTGLGSRTTAGQLSKRMLSRRFGGILTIPSLLVTQMSSQSRDQKTTTTSKTR